MIILQSVRWICLMHSTLCLVRLSQRNVQSISQSSSLGRIVLWFPTHVMAPIWTIKFRDRCPARGSSVSTFLFFFSLVLHNLVLSIAQDKDCLSLLFNRWYLDDGVLSGHTHRLLPGQRLSFKRWVHRWGCLSTFLNVSCLDMVTCPPSLLR